MRGEILLSEDFRREAAKEEKNRKVRIGIVLGAVVGGKEKWKNGGMP